MVKAKATKAAKSSTRYPFYSIYELAALFPTDWRVDTRRGTVTAYVDVSKRREKPLTSRDFLEEQQIRLAGVRSRHEKMIAQEEQTEVGFPFNNAGKKLFDLAMTVSADGHARWYRQGTFLPKLMNKKKADDIVDHRNQLYAQWNSYAANHKMTVFDELFMEPLDDSLDAVVFMPDQLFSLDFRVNDEDPENIFTEVWLVRWRCQLTTTYLSGRGPFAINTKSDYDGSHHANTLHFQQLPDIIDDEYFTYEYGSSHRQNFYLTFDAAYRAIQAKYSGLVIKAEQR